MTELLTVEEYRARHDNLLSTSQINRLCAAGKIAGAAKRGGAWWLPSETIIKRERAQRKDGRR